MEGVASLNSTSDSAFNTAKPRGKVQHRPAPITAGSVARRARTVGAVGEVPHASADVEPGVDVLPPSSNTSAAGVVGVTPMAAGLPRLYDPAVAAVRAMPISISL